MLYGMSYDEYWHGDPWLVVPYREAYLLRQRKRNEEMWIQGLYFCKAVSVAIHNNFDKSSIDYFKAPLDLYPKTYAEEQEEIRQERLKVVQKLSFMSALFNNKQKGTDIDGEP